MPGPGEIDEAGIIAACAFVLLLLLVLASQTAQDKKDANK